MVKLLCAIVDIEGSAFTVEIDDGDLVAYLQKAIKAEKANDLKNVDASRLRLFLAKKDGAWLKEDDPAVQDLYKGEIHSDIQKMIDGEQGDAMETLQQWLFDDNKMLQPSSEQLHVLVVSSVYVHTS